MVVIKRICAKICFKTTVKLVSTGAGAMHLTYVNHAKLNRSCKCCQEITATTANTLWISCDLGWSVGWLHIQRINLITPHILALSSVDKDVTTVKLRICYIIPSAGQAKYNLPSNQFHWQRRTITTDLVWNGIKLSIQLAHGDRLGIDRAINDFLIFSVTTNVELCHGISHSVYHRCLAAKWLTNQHKSKHTCLLQWKSADTKNTTVSK